MADAETRRKHSERVTKLNTEAVSLRVIKLPPLLTGTKGECTGPWKEEASGALAAGTAGSRSSDTILSTALPSQCRPCSQTLSRGRSREKQTAPGQASLSESL